MGKLTHHIGLTIPMKWVPKCLARSTGCSIKSYDITMIYYYWIGGIPLINLYLTVSSFIIFLQSA